MKITKKHKKQYELAKTEKLLKKHKLSDKNLEKKLKEAKHGLDKNIK